MWRFLQYPDLRLESGGTGIVCRRSSMGAQLLYGNYRRALSATGDGDIAPMLDSRLPAMPRSIFFEYCNDTQKNHEYLERKISEPVTYIAGAGISQASQSTYQSRLKASNPLLF